MMSLLSIKINFFKTIEILNIFQYILTHLILSNQIQYNEQDFFSNLALMWLSCVTDHYVRKDYYVRRTITSAKCGTIMSAGPLRPQSAGPLCPRDHLALMWLSCVTDQSVGPLCPRDHYVRKVRDHYVRGTIMSAKCGAITSAGPLCLQSAGRLRPRDCDG